jgi:hypothetical protein
VLNGLLGKVKSHARLLRELGDEGDAIDKLHHLQSDVMVNLYAANHLLHSEIHLRTPAHDASKLIDRDWHLAANQLLATGKLHTW